MNTSEFSRQIPTDSATRSSDIRRQTLPGRRLIARGFYEMGIHADAITAIGLAGVIKKSIEEIRNGPQKGVVERLTDGLELAAYFSLDGIDGEERREAQRLNPKPLSVFEQDKKRGALKDAGADRLQETALGVSRAVIAHRRGDIVGEMAAYAEIITGGWPSIVRSKVEQSGSCVNEGGIGSRPARAITATIKTVFPEVQAIGDIAGTGLNIKTAIDRSRLINVSTEKKPTPSEQEDAFEREKVLVACNLVAIEASLVTYSLLRKKDMSGKSLIPELLIGLAGASLYRGYEYLKDRKNSTDHGRLDESEDQPNANSLYAKTINEIEARAQERGIDHRFVGGTFTDLLTEDTKAVYDFENRTIQLTNHLPHGMFRSNGTVKDVDMICFDPDQEKVNEFKKWLQEEGKNAKLRGDPYPDVNMEPTRYADWKKRNSLTQFVSGIDVDEDGQMNLTFGGLKKPIADESMEAWNVLLEDGSSITTLSPFAHAMRYSMRVPSGFKPKDLVKKYGKDADGNPAYTKLDLVKLVARQASDKGLDFWLHDYKDGIYEPWVDFTKKMYQHAGSVDRIDIFTASKALTTAGYWRTVGPALSHGIGILKPFASLGGVFTG